MNRAIVTGATGFIGKFLVRELLKQKVDVIAVVRENSPNISEIDSFPIEIVQCNIENFVSLPEKVVNRNVDAVFHLAWQGISDLDAKNQRIQLQNLQSTLDVIDAMR